MTADRVRGTVKGGVGGSGYGEFNSAKEGTAADKNLEMLQTELDLGLATGIVPVVIPKREVSQLWPLVGEVMKEGRGDESRQSPDREIEAAYVRELEQGNEVGGDTRDGALSIFPDDDGEVGEVLERGEGLKREWGSREMAEPEEVKKSWRRQMGERIGVEVEFLRRVRSEVGGTRVELQTREVRE